MTDPALQAADDYEHLAAAYDRLTAADDYTRVAEIYTDALNRHGLEGRKLLDIACGTGKSTEALQARGFKVTGCDISGSMLRQARLKPGLESVELICCDMRELPQNLAGRFDAVTCIDDAMNHLLTEDDLMLAFSGARTTLRRGGRFAFDVNTMLTYNDWFAKDHILEDESGFLLWQGNPVIGPRLPEVLSATIIALGSDGTGQSDRSDAVVKQCHHDSKRIKACLAAAGFQILAHYGLARGQVWQPPDEHRHVKTVYVAAAV